MSERGAFVPEGFEVPRVLVGTGYRLVPLGPEHHERDYAAWMGSLDHIRATPGFPTHRGDWPCPMEPEENLADVKRHARDFADRTGFTYTVLDGVEVGDPDSDVIGCVYLYPGRPGSGVDVWASSWVVADRADLDVVLWQEVGEWLAAAWPFAVVDYAARTGGGAATA
jgi:hypothetical protein